jgi:ubiquinone/menaquinone biosynthesis C-methylase UbiE
LQSVSFKRESALIAISFSYDGQAPSFDTRTGLTDAVAAKIAKAIMELSGLASGVTVVEVGAGTGEIGVRLIQQQFDYIGLDNSSGMLAEFRARLDNESTASLACCDANQPWPIKDQSAQLIFGSRVFHLLNARHVAREVLRVADPQGAVLLLGRVVRDKKSAKAQMRSRMRELLLENGVQPRQSRRIRGHLLDELSGSGSLLEPTVAANWKKTARPADSVRSWMSKDSMGGIVPPASIKAAILDELMEWAAKRFGSPEAEIVSAERYVLEGVRLPKQKKPKR